MRQSDIDTFLGAYWEAIHFTDIDNPDMDFVGATMSSELIERNRKDCASFLRDCESAGIDFDEIEPVRTAAYSSLEQAGHDFWLTRNGHGVGFWDGDWKEPEATKLDELAKSFGTLELYLGDDGLVYGM